MGASALASSLREAHGRQRPAGPCVALAHRGGAARLLLVEDDPAARDGISAILRAAGHEVRAVASGREAIAALREAFDALLTDLTLGDMTGVEVARVARHRDSAARVILITGWDDAVTEVEGYADLVLTKPVRRQELLAALAELLG
jgi:DNA-binding response OmpR family regulator